MPRVVAVARPALRRSATSAAGVSPALDPDPRHAGPPHPEWSSLPKPARLFRVAHVAWSAVSLAALADVWMAALGRGRGQRPLISAAWLLLEGAALLVGRGDCPAGGLQRRLGDPVPMFELLLPPRAARAAIPVLAVVAGAGIIALAARSALDQSGARRPGP